MVKHNSSYDKAIELLDLSAYLGFCLLVFLVPLLFLSSTKEWFAIPKITLFRVGVTFILCCWMVKQLFSKQLKFYRTKLDLIVLLFLLSAFISTLFSIHPITSLFGKSGRYEGFTTLVAYGILFFMANQIFCDIKRANVLLNIATLATFLIALYGFFQYLGYDFVPESQLFWEANRSFSTLGNPVLLGGYLAMMLPIILSKFLATPSANWRFFYGGSFLLSCLSLITTFSRGGWLAALAGLLILILIEKKRLASKEAAVLCMVLLLIFLAFNLANYVRVPTLSQKDMSISERISSLSKVREGSIGSRLLIWQSTLKMIAKRPLLGWGPDVFHFAFLSFSSPDFVRLEGASKRADNAHNYFLHLAATQGLLGLFAYLALLLFFFWTGFRYLFSAASLPPRTCSPFAGLLAGLGGYVAYLLSGINSVEMGVIFWTLLGVISIQTAKGGEWKRKNFSSIFRILLVLVVVLIAVVSSVFSLEPLFADIHYAKAEKLEQNGSPDLAIKEAKAALLLNPYQDRYARYLGQLYMAVGDQNNALSSYLKAKEMNHLEIDNSGRLAEFYIQKALHSDSKYFALAKKELLFILKINPYSAVARSGLGFLYLTTGHFAKAVQELNKATTLDPNDARAQLFLGMAFEELNMRDKARATYRKVLRLDWKNKDAKEALKRLEKE